MEIRTRLAAELAMIDGRIALLGGKPAATPRLGRPPKGAKRGKRAKLGRPPGRRQVGGVAGKSLKEFLVDAMKNGETMRARDLTDAVLAAGYATKDRNFRQTVASALAGDKRFRRIRRGMYKLAAAAK
jgi:hypothetical protein